MGNQSSKDGFIVDNKTSHQFISNKIRSNSYSYSNGTTSQTQQQLRAVVNNVNNKTILRKSSASRLLPVRKCNNGAPPPLQSAIVVSPVRHQLLFTDHVTPLVSLSSAAATSSSTTTRDTRSMSSTSLASDEEPKTPTWQHHCQSSSFDEFVTNSYLIMSHDMQKQQQQQQRQNKLSSSLPITHSDGSVINTTVVDNRSFHKNRDSCELWVYEYGAEKERDRQTRQHYLLKQVLRGNIHVELCEPTRILESACGVGLWSLETAQDYPKCQIIGIDVIPPSEKEGWNLSNKTTSAGQSKKNVSFQYGDILKPALLFPDNHFDLVYQRDVATVLPFIQWPTLIHEFYRVLKPGAKIQLVEYDLLFKNPGPVLTQVNEWYRIAASTIDVDPDYTVYLAEYLKEAGFIEIQEDTIDIPIGEWSSDDLQKQYGYLYKEQMKALFKSMKKWWCTEIKVSQQEYDQMCAGALEEFEEYQSSARWKIFTATKPTAAAAAAVV